jgi:hypothetical protein
MITDSDLNGCAQVRNAPVPEAWSPGPSGLASGFSSPVMNVKSDLSGASDSIMGVSVQFVPVVVG